jgi:hypothetical protein
MTVERARQTNGDKRSEPALFITAQTTIPTLTEIMSAFSIGLIAIVAAFSGTSNPLLWGITLKDLALVMLGFSALLFWLATESCIKSQAWDYYAVSKERRTADNLSTEADYIASCLEVSRDWYVRAVYAYRFGGISMILGVAILFWPISRLTSVAMGLYVPCYEIFRQWAKKKEVRKLSGRT